MLAKIYSKCCKIFKAYLTSRRVNFVLTHFSYLAAKFCVFYILKISSWRKSLSHKLSIDLQKKSIRLVFMRQRYANYVRSECIWFFKTTYTCKYVKKRLYLRRFHIRFYITTAFETFCELFFKLLNDCF